MTIAEMHASILLKIDRVGSYSTSNLISGEIDDFINQAIRDYVTRQQKVLRRSPDSEQSSDVQENLRTILETSETTAITDHPFLDKVFVVDLSELTDYDYFVSGRALFDGDYKILRPVATHYIVDDEKTEHDNPFTKGIPCAIEGDELWSRYPTNISSKPDEVIVNYVQTPVDVLLDESTPSNSVDCNLPERAHRDVVDIAASKIISSLSGQDSTQNQSNE
jgi:hypothetical protein